MIRNHYGNVAPLLPFSPEPRHSVLGAQDGFGGRRAEGAYGLGPDRQQLAEEELPANFHLIGLRRAIFRGAALDYVADINVAALDRDALFMGRPLNHLREKLSGPADERQPLRVLV